MTVILQSNSPDTTYVNRYCFGTWEQRYSGNETIEGIAIKNPTYLILMELE